jgi:hypothetical protein
MACSPSPQAQRFSALDSTAMEQQRVSFSNFRFLFSNFRFTKKNEAPCGLLFRAALQPYFFVCVSYWSSLFQAFPSYPPYRWAELVLD